MTVLIYEGQEFSGPDPTPLMEALAAHRVEACIHPNVQNLKLDEAWTATVVGDRHPDYRGAGFGPTAFSALVNAMTFAKLPFTRQERREPETK